MRNFSKEMFAYIRSHLHLSVIIIFTLHGNAKREVACRFQLKTDNNPTGFAYKVPLHIL